MAAIGKIRSKGKILAIIIGLALFSFIAEELFRSCQSTRADRMQQVGEVLGKKISLQEFSVLFEEYQEVVKLQRGVDNLSETDLNQAKDVVWNTFVQGKIVENEAKKLGLAITDEELQAVLNQGTNPMLRQTPFVDQATGLFDANQLKMFLAEYSAQQKTNPQAVQQYQSIYRYWTFTEKMLRQQLLTQKYQALFANCFLTNEIETKAVYEANKDEATIVLAAFAYNDVPNDDIEITNDDIKKKYAEVKGLFRQYDETRNVKYIDVKVDASAADRRDLLAQVNGYAADLAATSDPAEVVRKSTSLIPYLGVPVKKNAFPADISTMIDSLSVGETSKVFETKRDNTLNVLRVVSKESLPDTVVYRQIQVFADTPDAAHSRADSIYNALQGGADFELIAKNYAQTGEEITLTTAQYQTSPTIDADSKVYLENLNTLHEGEIKNVALTQGNVVVQILSRKGFVDKYICAVVKKTIDFSHDTYSAAYNKFASFVSANQTEQDIVDNAEKEGYVVRDFNDLTTAAHNIAGIASTRDALKWAFGAKEGQVSPLYECGSNDRLLVVVLDRINKKGYAPLTNPEVSDRVSDEITKAKKADVLLAEMGSVKSIDEAKSKGCKTDTIAQISFSSPVFVRIIAASEAPLAGAVAATEQGQFSKKPVVGDGGVYVFSVINRTAKPGEYDEEQVRGQIKQRAMQAAGAFTAELYNNAQVVDNRYLFY